jgi:NodT family efflux transporter outer membrane factor (OMF) lipoprotein
VKRFSFMLVATSALAGCTVGPNFRAQTPSTPPAPTAAQFAEQMALDTRIDTRWWRVFEDPVLDGVIDRALTDNLDLQIAAARIERSRAQLRTAGAAGLPSAGGAASYMRERASGDGIMALTGASSPSATAAGGGDPFGTANLPGTKGNSDFDLFQTGFDASWELDLWGRARRLREAAKADAQAAVYEREAARISLSAEVVAQYVALRGAEARLLVLRRNREAVARVEGIARRREAEGAASRYDAASASTQLAAIDSAIPGGERDVSVHRNALALLAGCEPHVLDMQLAVPEPKVPTVPVRLPGGLASSLAHARPDILAAEARLHAATARIGVAKADFYPSLVLTGSAGTQSLESGDLFAWGARQFIAGPVLHIPIFEGGRLKGQLELTEADQKAAAIQYRATVLRAWHEVDDALELLRSEAKRVTAAQRGVEQGRIATHVAERRYSAGATSYLDVLVAQRTELEREAEYTQALTAHASALAALYKSLGGGWTPIQAEMTGAAGA